MKMRRTWPSNFPSKANGNLSEKGSVTRACPPCPCPTRLRRARRELSDGHFGQHVIDQSQRARVHASAAAARTEAATLAAPSYRKVLVAGLAEKVRKASRQNPTVEEVVQLVGH